MADTVNSLVNSAISKAYAENPSMFGGFPEIVIRDAFASAMNELFPAKVELSTTVPDYESIVIQLTTELSKDAIWYDFNTAATGQALIRYIAAGIAYGQFSIERALHEAFPSTASSDNSIFAIADLLGVRVQRVIPAHVTVRLTRTDTATLFELPRFTTFTINDIPFFSRERIIFPVDIQTIDIELHQGTLLQLEVGSNGQPFMDIELGDGNKDLSDVDTYVWVNGREWKRSVDNVWNFKELDEFFWDHTTPSGNLMVSFGSGIFGKVPPVNALIKIIWARCLGEVSNYSATDLTVTYKGPSLNTQLTGVTVSNITGAKDMLNADFYSLMAPNARASGKNAVRCSDYRRHAVEYPLVRDALFRGQAELGPRKRSMMNVIGVTLLSDVQLNDLEWARFVDYMTSKGIYQCEFRRMDPTPVNITIVADIFCSQKASLETVRQILLSEISKMFELRLGGLGYSIARSDITDVLEGIGETGGLVDYVVLKQPTTDSFLTNKAQYIRLQSVTLNMFYSTRANFSGRLDLDVT